MRRSYDLAERKAPARLAVPVRNLVPAAQAPDFLDTMRKLWRHWRLIVAATLVVGAVSVIAAYAIPSYYIASAKVLIGVPEPRIFASDQLLDAGGPDAEKVENERIAMLSHAEARAVIARLDLAHNPEFAPRAAGRPSLWQRLDPLRWFGAPKQATATPAAAETALVDNVLAHIEVTRMGRAQVLEIEAKASRPGLAARLANSWAEVYLDAQRNNKLATTHRVETYLDRRIAELRKQVADSEQAVEDYRRKYALYHGATASVTSQQLTELNSQLTVAQTAKAEADAKLDEAEALQRNGADGGSDPTVLDSRTIQSLKQQEAQDERHLAELRSTFGDRYPAVVEAKAEVTNVRGKIAAEIGRTIEGLRNAARTADLRFAAVEQDFANLKTRVGVANDKAIHLQALERDATVSRNLLETMLSRAGETIGRQEIETPDARLISAASPPLALGFPPRKLIILLGTLGGVLIGMLVALLRESGDRSLHAAEEIRALTGLPLIASVPTIGGRAPAAQVLRRPGSPFTEALRRIHMSLLLAEARRTPKTILVTSSVPAEGKTVLAASLARLLAANGRRVLAMDCDWRSPALHRVFQCPNRIGLAAVLTETQPSLRDLIFTDPASGVDVLAAGNWTSRMAHMMASERMRRILDTFADNYDFVVLDGPPVLAAAEVLPLARLVDKALFVVRWGDTPREAVLDALGQLADAEVDMAGIVFSRVDARRYRHYSYGNLNYEYARQA